MNTRLFRLAACLPLLGLAPAQAGVVPIDPFVGERSDPLDYPNTIIVASFPIFGNTASLDSHNGQTFIHYLLSDTFIGDVVTPRTGGHILGFTEGPGIFRFNEPVRRFGMYFNNNSGTDDTTCDFYDAEGNLLASLTATTPFAGNVWVWNGWESDVPFTRVVVTGHGIIDGFLWFDDLEVSSVPSAGSGVVCVGALGVMRRRRGDRV